MSYQVRILARARQDFEDYIAWIAERSPRGAERWAAAFEAALARLEKNPYLSPVASESEDIGEEVRNILFRTKSRPHVPGVIRRGRRRGADSPHPRFRNSSRNSGRYQRLNLQAV